MGFDNIEAANERCDDCHGTGEVTVVIRESPSRRRAGEVEIETRGQRCQACDGTGEVPAPPPRVRRAVSRPAAIHCGAEVRDVAPGVWVESVGRAIILHATSDELLRRVASEFGRAIEPSQGLNGVWTTYFVSRHAERALERAGVLARAGALPLVDGQRATHNGYAPEPANDAGRRAGTR